MIDEQRLSYQLNMLCKWQGIKGKEEYVLKEAAAAMGMDPKNELWRLPARYVGTYGEGDVLSTLALAQALRPQLEKEELTAAYKLEMDLVPMVHAMRQRGICIDIDRCEQLYANFKHQSQIALDDISDKLGQTTGIDDIRSTGWLEKAFDANHIRYPRTKKTDKGSFEAKWMKKHEHWLPRLITRAKSREEAAEKFVKGYLMDFCDPDARIHPTIHQYRGERHGEDDDDRGGGTRTYRFSYADPPLQQIPHRDEEMVEIRDAFIGEDGEKWLSVDYSQQEFRLMVHYASLIKYNGVPGLPGALAAARRYKDDPDTDFHSMVAEMTGLDRKPAKDCNFAKAYGAGVAKFATMIGKSTEEAEAIMKQYDERLPFIRMMGQHCQRTAEDRGFIKLLDGARIHFNFWFAGWREHGFTWNNQSFSSHTTYEECIKRVNTPGHPWHNQRPRRSGCNKAMNALIQGGAARMTKLAMRDVWRAGYCPTLQIHDELCFSIKHEKEAEEIAMLMRDTVKLNVPMKADIAIGDSWYER
jgi:DNA polymerase I